MPLDYLWSPFIMAVQLFVATALYTRHQPRRPRFQARVIATTCAYLAGTVAVTWVGYVGSPELMGSCALFSQTVMFAVLVILWVGIVWLCFDLSPLEAAFVAIAVYSTQNLADSVSGLLQIVRSEVTGLIPLDQTGQITTSAIGISFVGTLFTLVSTVLVYALCYRLFASKLTQAWPSGSNDRKIVVVFGAVLALEVALDLTLKSVFALEMGGAQRIMLAASKPLICLFILFSEFEVLLAGRLTAERDALDRVARERERQYELQAANVEAINVKVHDIKHQIRALAGGRAAVDAAVLEDLAHEVRVFDTSIKTGNDAIDTILTEKLLACEQAGVQLSCIVDGPALGFMPAAELYSLFGNALDNAIRAAAAVSDPSKRSVSFTVKERAGMVTIHVENRFEGEVSFRDGLPQTTKADAANHGFGTRSMQLIAESHGGVFTASAKDGVFYLNIMVPATV